MRRTRNPKHRQQWRNILATYADPVFGNLPVAAVDTAMLVKVLDPICRDKRETASRLRGRIEVILDWARVRDYRDGEDPARWKGLLEYHIEADKVFAAYSRGDFFEKRRAFMADWATFVTAAHVGADKVVPLRKPPA